jgi:hypothetical protein
MPRPLRQAVSARVSAPHRLEPSPPTHQALFKMPNKRNDKDKPRNIDTMLERLKQWVPRPGTTARLWLGQA